MSAMARGKAPPNENRRPSAKGRRFVICHLGSDGHLSTEIPLGEQLDADPLAFIRTARASQDRHRQRVLDLGLTVGRCADALVSGSNKDRVGAAAERVRP